MCLSFQIRQSLFFLPFLLNLFATFSQTNLATANKLNMGHTAKSTSLALLGKIILVPIILKRPLFYENNEKIKKLWWAGFSEIYFFQCNWSENVYTATKTILWLNLHSTIYPKLDKTTSDYRIVQKAEISTPLRAIQKYNALFIFCFELKEGNDVYSEWNFWFLLKKTLWRSNQK